MGNELYRKGTVATVLPGHQTLERAWFYGLRMAAHYINLSTQVKIHVMSTRAWEAWVQGKHGHQFHDLEQLVTIDQRRQVQALSISMQQVRQMPTGVMTLKNRYHDATKAATEIALSLRPHAAETELKQQDLKYKRVAPQAIQRICFLMDNKEHFMNQEREKGKVLRNQTQEQKRREYEALQDEEGEGKHQWTMKGRAKQCSLCFKKVTLHNTLAELQAFRQERCQGNPTSLVGGQVSANMPNKKGIITEIIEGKYEGMGNHAFEIQNQYMVCQACGVRMLKHSATDKVIDMAQQKCWNETTTPPPAWQGHPTHTMWRRSKTVSCTKCKARAVAKGATWMESKALKQRCGEPQAQVTLPACFKAKTAA